MFSTALRRLTSQRSSKARIDRSCTSPRSTHLSLEPLEDRRLLAVGDLDPTFGNGGRVLTDFADFTEFVGSDDQANAVVVQTDGKVLVVGKSVLGATQHGAITRLNPDGTLDQDFGTGGKITTALVTEINDVVLLPDGRFLVTGPLTGPTSTVDFGVIQYQADGSIDEESFGNRGVAIATFAGGLADIPHAITRQADGRIVVVGQTQITPTNTAFGVARFSALGNADATFDVDGQAVVDFAANVDIAYDVVIDSSDRIVMAGSADLGAVGDLDFALARLDTNGTLDATFNTDGRVTTDFNQNRDDEAFSLLIQSSGNLVAAGYAEQLKVVGADDDFAMARYDNNGNLLLGFGINGKVTTDFTRDTTSPTDDRIQEIAAQSNGQIVAAGWSWEVTTNPIPRRDVALARYAAVNGAIDTTLDPNTGGRLLPAFFNFQFERANALAIQPDGKWVAAGFLSDSPSNFGILRLNPTGQLDTGFGNAGRVVVDFTEFVGAEDIANVVLEQPDGKVLVAGGSVFGASRMGSISRYLADGTLDPDFGSGGRIATDLVTVINDLVLLPNGKILVTGPTPVTALTPTVDFAVLQFNVDGTLDVEGFGNRGMAVTNFPTNGTDIPYGLVRQSDGRIVVAGSTELAPGDTAFGVARFTALGNIDATFSATADPGTAFVDFGAGADTAYDVALDTFGRIVLAGSADVGAAGDLEFALARLDDLGTLDTTFNIDGRVTTDFNQQRDDEAFSLLLQPGGFIVAGGYANQQKIFGPDEDFALARYDNNGDLQLGFGAGGKATVDFTRDTNAPTNDRAQGIAAQADGQIVAAGWAWESPGPLNPNPRRDVAVARFAPVTGAIDTTLDPATGGRLLPAFFNLRFERANAIDIQQDGRWLMAGFVHDTPSNFGVLRLTPTGQFDSTFGNDGRVVTDFTEFVGSNDVINAVVVQQDGKILVAGTASLSVTQGAFARYNPDGTLDETFGIGGRLTTTLFDEIRDLTLLPDGRILAIGPFTPSGGNVDFGVIQLKSDGALDEDNFGNRGLAFANFPSNLDDQPYAVVRHSDGKIIVAGQTRLSAANSAFGVARFTSIGNLDASFAVGGRATVDFFGGDDIAYDVAIDGLNRIVMVGSSEVGPGFTTTDFALARLEATGIPDNTFNTDGRATTDFNQNRSDVAYSLVLQPGAGSQPGFIVAAGYADQQKFQGPTPFPPDRDFALARYNNNGDLQGGFGNGGKSVTDYTRDTNVPSDDEIGEIQIDGAGNIVAAGRAWERAVIFNPRQDVAAARYNGVTGAIDTSLDPDTGGRLLPPYYGFGENAANALAIQPDGNWILAGQTGDHPHNFGVQRLGDSVPVVIDADVEYTLRLTNLGGLELPRNGLGQYQIGAGVVFIAEVFVTDSRTPLSPSDLREGVFSAFADLVDQLDFVDWVTGTLVVASGFPDAVRGSINLQGSNDIVDDAGGASTAPLATPASQLLFRVQGQVRPTTPLNTVIDLQLNPADNAGNLTLLWGAARVGQIASANYEAEKLVVVTAAPPWQNPRDPLDVNDDGNVDVLDLQLIRQQLRNPGAGPLPAPSPGNQPDPTPLIPGNGDGRFFDVDGDGLLTILDLGLVREAVNNTPLRAQSSGDAGASGPGLTVADATPLLEAAIERFVAAGISGEQLELLNSVEVQVADLSGDLLAVVIGTTVVVDRDAAGLDWFLDATPGADDEFAVSAGSSSPAAGGIDLLTVLAHELGHVLGLEHSSAEEDLMAETLAVGVRRLPTADLLEQIFAEDTDW